MDYFNSLADMKDEMNRGGIELNDGVFYHNNKTVIWYPRKNKFAVRYFDANDNLTSEEFNTLEDAHDKFSQL